MWPRTLTNSIGMDEDTFTKAFIKALQNESVVNSLKTMFTMELQREINELKRLVEQKDNKIKELEKHVSDLDMNCDSLEQYSRRNSVRVYGIVEKEFENPVDVALDLINNKLKIDMNMSALDRVHRIGKKKNDAVRPLIVKFATYRERNRVYRAKQRLKSDNTERIFLNEDLTRKRSLLLYQARQLKKRKRINDCWSFDGQVLIKDIRGKVTPINSQHELDTITDRD